MGEDGEKNLTKWLEKEIFDALCFYLPASWFSKDYEKHIGGKSIKIKSNFRIVIGGKTVVVKKVRQIIQDILWFPNLYGNLPP